MDTHSPQNRLTDGDSTACWHRQPTQFRTTKPAVLGPGQCEEAAIARLTARLKEAERAYDILRAKGYGRCWMGLDEIAQLVPDRVVTNQAHQPNTTEKTKYA